MRKVLMLAVCGAAFLLFGSEKTAKAQCVYPGGYGYGTTVYAAPVYAGYGYAPAYYGGGWGYGGAYGYPYGGYGGYGGSGLFIGIGGRRGYGYYGGGWGRGGWGRGGWGRGGWGRRGGRW